MRYAVIVAGLPVYQSNSFAKVKRFAILHGGQPSRLMCGVWHTLAS